MSYNGLIFVQVFKRISTLRQEIEKRISNNNPNLITSNPNRKDYITVIP